MKENAKLVLPKIAPFNEEDENDVSATLKEDEESKTRSQRKRKAKVKSLSENLPRINSSGTLNLTCLGVGERDTNVPGTRKENSAMQQNAANGPSVNAAINPFLPSKIYKSIKVTGHKTVFDGVDLALTEAHLACAQKMMTWPAVPWIFRKRRRAGTEDLACLLLITRALMRTRLPRVAIEGWVPGTVAIPTFHCQKCLNHWRAYGELPRECKEPEETVEGPPMYITGKANVGKKMSIQNAYTTRGSPLQMCIDVTTGKQSRASDVDLGALDTTDEVDADTLWDLRPNDLGHCGSDDSVLDENIHFLSHSHMATGGHGTGGHGTGGHGTGGHGTGGHGTGGYGTGGHGTGGHGTGGHGSLASDATAARLPPIIVPSNTSGTTQMVCATSVARRHSPLADSFEAHEGGDSASSVAGGGSVLADSLEMQGGNDHLSMHGNSHHKHGTHKSGSSSGQDSRASDHASSAVAQDCTEQHGGRMVKDGQGILTDSCMSGLYGESSVGRAVGCRGDDEPTNSSSREYIETSDLMPYGTVQKQATKSLHPQQGSGYGDKRSSDRKGGVGTMKCNGTSPGSNTASLSTADANRSSALAEGEGLMGPTVNGNECSSNRDEQLLHTNSTVLSPKPLDDKSTFTRKHKGPSGGRNEQSKRLEDQNWQSPSSSQLRSTALPVEPSHTAAGGPGHGKAPGQDQPRTQEKKAVRQATIKENVEYVPDKVRVGKRKKTQLKKSIRPTESSQTTSTQGSAMDRRGSYLLAQAGSQTGMHQIDTSKLEEQRQSGASVPQGSTAPHALQNTTKSRDVSFPTKHNSKNLDEVVHQSPALYQNKRKPLLENTDINPSSSGDGHGQRIPSGWREGGDPLKGQTSSRLLARDQDMIGIDASTDTAGRVSSASNVKGHGRNLPFTYGTDSESSAMHKFLQQQSQALDSTARRPSSSAGQSNASKDRCPSRGKAAGGTQIELSATGTASTCESEGTTTVQAEVKVSNGISSEAPLGTISEASDGDEALAELEYYSSVRPSGFNLTSMMNFTTRSFTYSMFPMSKQHKELYNATHTTANTTSRRQIKRTAVKS